MRDKTHLLGEQASFHVFPVLLFEQQPNASIERVDMTPSILLLSRVQSLSLSQHRPLMRQLRSLRGSSLVLLLLLRWRSSPSRRVHRRGSPVRHRRANRRDITFPREERRASRRKLTGLVDGGVHTRWDGVGGVGRHGPFWWEWVDGIDPCTGSERSRCGWLSLHIEIEIVRSVSGILVVVVVVVVMQPVGFWFEIRKNDGGERVMLLPSCWLDCWRGWSGRTHGREVGDGGSDEVRVGR